MTRDEVKKIIADEIGWKLVTPKLYSANTYAEAVLAAFAARGLIVGERVSNDEFERTHGIAVVRVVE